MKQALREGSVIIITGTGGEQLRMEGRKAQESQAEICECGLYHGGLEGSTGF